MVRVKPYERVTEDFPIYEFIWSETPSITEKVIRVDSYLCLLEKKLNAFYLQFKDKKLNFKEVLKFLNNEFNSYHIFFTYIVYQKDDPYNVGINKGDTGIKDNNIDIIITCTSLVEDMFVNFKNFKYVLMTLFKHELVHRIQFLKIKNEELRIEILKNIRKSKDDYSNIFEIMAYANNIIEELRFKGNTDDEIIDILRNKKLNKSDTLDYYVNLYYESDLEVLHKLYKYVYEYLKGK